MKITIKRLAVFVLCLTLALQCLSGIAQGAEEQKTVSEKTGFVISLGLFDGLETVEGSAYISGAQFAIVLKNITGQDYAAGYPNLRNLPRIQIADAVKVMTDILGYSPKAEQEGGFPEGYWKNARELRMTDGVNPQAFDRITFDQLGILLYNCLEIPLMETEYIQGGAPEYRVNRDKTFQKDILFIECISGRVDANGYADLDGNGVTDREEIRIDKTILSGADADDAWLLGQRITAYYSIREKNEKRLVHTVLNSGCRVVSLKADELEGYGNLTVSYSDEKGRTRRISLEKDVQVFKNFDLLKNFGESDFLIDNGRILFIFNGNSKAETVLIEEYKDFLAAEKKEEKNIFYNKLQDPGGSRELRLTGEEIICTAEGKLITPEEIPVQACLSVCKGTEYTRILVSTQVAEELRISRVEKNEEETVFYAGDTEYSFSKAYRRSRDWFAPKAGDTVVAMLNAFGEVMWLAREKESGKSEGYLIKAVLTDGLSETLQLKVLTSGGRVEHFDCSAKLKLYNGTDHQTYSGKEAFRILLNYQGVMTYALDSAKAVKQINLPADDGEDLSNTDLIRMDLSKKGGLPYKSWSAGFAGQVYVTDRTIIYAIPPDVQNFEDYQVISRKDLINDTYYKFEAYVAEAESVVAEAVVIRDYRPAVDIESHAIVVTQIGDAIGKDGETIRQAEGVRDGSPVTLWANLDSGTSAFEAASDFPTKEKNLCVVPGDIIRITQEPRTGEVEEVEILFKSDAVNPAFPQGQKGNLSGTIGVYSDAVKNTNPYTYSGNELGGNAKLFSNAELRVYYGWVYRKENGILTVTNQDLSCSTYQGDEDERYVVESHLLGIYRDFTVVEENERTHRYEAKSGGESDIRAYGDVGADCSRVLILTAWGDPVQIVVLN